MSKSERGEGNPCDSAAQVGFSPVLLFVVTGVLENILDKRAWGVFQWEGQDGANEMAYLSMAHDLKRPLIKSPFRSSQTRLLM